MTTHESRWLQKVFVRSKAADVINTFHEAAGRWGDSRRRVVLALGTDRLGEVFLQQGPHHLQPGSNCECEQSFLHLAGERGKLDGDLLGELDLLLPGFLPERYTLNLGQGGLSFFCSP